ncbi:hypothetical protein RhiirC2_727174 [Rhizophagus irregularis]|uniref:Uncharacterized protein n=1 Tax=Rhizophagus irregularis TaxID=588596 RepID=A0A2N1NZZ1_9GLOM|nr:hypothetical protein RhiirC2_727174 [Rhizophagus irregularis]
MFDVPIKIQNLSIKFFVILQNSTYLNRIIDDSNHLSKYNFKIQKKHINTRSFTFNVVIESIVTRIK